MAAKPEKPNTVIIPNPKQAYT